MTASAPMGITAVTKVCLVHGFNVKDAGAGTVDQLAPFIIRSGYEVDCDETDYGYFGLLDVRLRNGKRRQKVLYRLARAFESADIIITHSNGANFTHQALDMLPDTFVNSKLVIHISPALDRDASIPNSVRKALVLHTPHDKWVRLSTYLPGHPWGRMGAYGYDGTDKRVTNRNCPEIEGHSDWFKDRHVTDCWSTCHNFIEVMK